LSVLLKRMGVPWIYRAFANTSSIRTSIAHTARELTLRDQSKFGSHVVSYALDGAWAPVVQYGNQRHGQCRVTCNPAQQSVTVETVYFGARSQQQRAVAEATPVQGQQAPGTPGSVPTPHAGAGTKDARSMSTFSTGSNDESLLTMESPVSPARGPEAGRGEMVDSGVVPDPDAPRSQSAEHSPAHSRQRSEAEAVSRGSRANSDPTARHLMLTQPESSLLAAADAAAAAAAAAATAAATATPNVSSHSPAGGRRALRMNGVAVSDPASRHTRGSASSSRSSSMSLAPTTPLPSTPLSGPSAGPGSGSDQGVFGSPLIQAPSQGSMTITSRLIDIRVLLSQDTMRQVLTYLEAEVVVCVCSRTYRREVPREERKKKDARKTGDQPPPPPPTGPAPDAAKDAKKNGDESGGGNRGAPRQSGGGGGGVGAPSPAGNQRATGPASAASPSLSVSAASSQSSSGHASHGSAPSPSSSVGHSVHAPVRVVLPTVPPPIVALPSASVGAAGSAGVAPPATALSLAAVTPAFAAFLFLLALSLASGHRVLTVLLLAACGAYAFQQHSKRAEEMQMQQQQGGGFKAPVMGHSRRASLQVPRRN
jgi:hypothetical protein